MAGAPTETVDGGWGEVSFAFGATNRINTSDLPIGQLTFTTDTKQLLMVIPGRELVTFSSKESGAPSYVGVTRKAYVVSNMASNPNAAPYSHMGSVSISSDVSDTAIPIYFDCSAISLGVGAPTTTFYDNGTKTVYVCANAQAGVILNVTYLKLSAD